MEQSAITLNSMPNQTEIERTQNAKVLVVDDNVDLLKLISIRLKPMKFELKTATSAEEALSLTSIWSPDLVVTDLQMQGMSGLELFENLHAKNPLIPVIILTAHGTIPEAVEATQSGVASYLTKPFDSDTLLTQIQLALIGSGFAPGNLTATVDSDSWRNKIISKSPLMSALLDQVAQLAATNTLVIIEGEPGTCKDELARAMHAKSHRANGPLTHLSCTSLSPELLEVEMFGRIGNGTAENPERLGLFRQADGGTLMFSDFNEATQDFVQRALIALDKGAAQPVDSLVEYSFDVRAITTTDFVGRYGRGRTSDKLWALGTKLGLIVLTVPSLKERPEDIPHITSHVLAQEEDRSIQFSNKAMQALLAADWPGNVRQLMNLVKQCVRLTNTKIVSDTLVLSRLSNPALQIQPLSNAHRNFERDYLTEVLKITNGNVTKAANLAKRNRTEFHRLLNKHKIEAKSFRQ